MVSSFSPSDLAQKRNLNLACTSDQLFLRLVRNIGLSIGIHVGGVPIVVVAEEARDEFERQGCGLPFLVLGGHHFGDIHAHDIAPTTDVVREAEDFAARKAILARHGDTRRVALID